VPESSGELLIYDQRGVERGLQVDGLTDAHGVAWDGDSFVAVSASNNRVVWIAPDGSIRRVWQAPGEGDCWHLNDIFVGDEDIYASAFGRFDSHRQWAAAGAAVASGIVFSLTSGRTLVSRLHYPHSPRLDSGWLICNSGAGELIETTPDDFVIRALPLGGWTRGLAVCGDVLFVGTSVQRYDPGARLSRPSANIAVVSRTAWVLTQVASIPCREIYDLTLVPRDLLRGLRRGARTYPLRVTRAPDGAGIPG
jgi:acetolactate synthase-1/2/3 large subunit